MTQLSAPYLFEYTYRRSVGAVLARFLAGLREGRIEGVRARDGRVLLPPAESDERGHATGDWVTVAGEGVVVTWAPEPRPRAGQPLDRPFAWALIKLDGADTALLHAVDAVSLHAGQRVRVRWRGERTGSIHDIACFEPVA